jgi:hypothetical protein
MLSTLENFGWFTKPLSFEDVEDCFPDEGSSQTWDGHIEVTAQFLHDFARAIEAKVRGEK